MRRIIVFSPQFLVFIVGGALSALIDIGLLQLLIANGASPLVATTLGFLAGLIVNYAFHAKVTFKNMSTLGTLTRFLSVVCINYLLTLGCVQASTGIFHLPLLGKLISLPIVALNGFFLGKYWIFK